MSVIKISAKVPGKEIIENTFHKHLSPDEPLHFSNVALLEMSALTKRKRKTLNKLDS